MDTSYDMLRTPLVTLTFCILCLNLMTPVLCQNATEEISECPDTEFRAHAYVIPCLHKGETFLKRYFRRYNRKSFEKCEEYQEFQECINPLLEKCPGVSAYIPEEWLTTVALLNCACSEHHTNHRDCDRSLTCMVNELEDVFAQRCEDRFELNMKQKTLSKCHFLHDYIHCKESIVSSACGSDAATLLFLVHQIAAWQSSSCQVRRLHNYQGFSYSERCPLTLASEIDSCLDNLPSVLSFNPDNDLVTTEDASAVKQACKAYRAYANCLNKWQEQCPLGVTMAMEQNDPLRVYLLKMQYICQKNNNGYIESVGCYKSVLEEDSLSECYPIWAHIEPLLKMTAYEFYCVTDSEAATKLKTELNKLTVCYKDVLVRECDQSAGEAMEGLITRAFQDPFYLQLDYVPNCYLHSRTPYDSAQIKSAQRDNRQKLRHKQHHHHKASSDSRHSKAKPKPQEEYVNKQSSIRNQINSASQISAMNLKYIILPVFILVMFNSFR